MSAELQARLAEAASPPAVAEAIHDATRAAFGYDTCTVVTFPGGLVQAPDLSVRSTEWPEERVKAVVPGCLAAIDHDLGGLSAALQPSRCFDVEVRYPLREIERSVLMQEYWRPYKADHQLVAALGDGPQPLASVNLVRSRRSGRFSERDLRALDAIRAVAERPLAAMRALGTDDLAHTLDALACAFPTPAYLFDAGGRLTWMSDEGALRLGLAAVRVGSSRLVGGNGALASMAALARLALARHGLDLDGPLRQSGLLARGERVVSRHFSTGGAPALLVLFTPAMAPVAGSAAPEQPAAGVTPSSTLAPTATGRPPRPVDRIPGLSNTETAVARLAVEGYTVTNMAAHLGSSESTVRTHLRRTYLKLGVHGRAELAWVLLRGGRAAQS